MTENLLEISHLTHKFPIDRRESLTALDDVSFALRRGEIFGLVGESGSGKSTLARCVMNVYRPTAGKILFNGIETTNPRVFRKNRAYLQSARQIIFQDSNSSLDPKWQAWQVIAEPMRLQHVTPKRGSYRAEAEFQMHYVGLDPLYLDKYPPELSGGQRQRLAIARALTMEPELLVADEPIAALDVSIQAQIVNLFRHLQQEHGFTFLFIAHDLPWWNSSATGWASCIMGGWWNWPRPRNFMPIPCTPIPRRCCPPSPSRTPGGSGTGCCRNSRTRFRRTGSGRKSGRSISF